MCYFSFFYFLNLMKNILLLLAGLALATAGHAQSSAIGRYEQVAFIAPDNLKMAESAVTLVKDPQLSKVVWIEHLLPGGRIKAVFFSSNDGTTTYAVPTQKVGNYQVQMGCAVYDGEEANLSVSLNNKANCFGMKQSDYDSGVGITKTGGIQAGGASINNKGIKTPGVDINKNDIKVDTKAVMAGVQYVGHKQGVKKTSDDD